MDWQNSAFDWNQARAFLATVEEGSLSAAARALGQAQPTVGRQVSALEARLGVVLFERIGRNLQLTPSGMDLAEHIRAMRDAADRVSLTAAGQSQSVEGVVRITVSDIFAVHLMPRVIAKVQQIAPRLQIEIVAENAISDLLRREADIAVRHVRPTEPDLIARLIAEARGYLYAADDYLARRGVPRHANDLKAHDFIGFGNIDEMIGYLAGMGIDLTPDNFRTNSADGNVAWELVAKGFGIGAMSDIVAAETSGISRILPDLPPIEFPVWLTTHRELQSSARIRLVFDCLASELWPQPR